MHRQHFLDRAVMFAQQSKWVDVDDFARTTVVCYDAEHLAERVAAAIRRITVPPCNVTIPRINAAPRRAEEYDLNDTHRVWLAARYERDYALWQEHCGDGERRAREERHGRRELGRAAQGKTHDAREINVAIRGGQRCHG